MEKAKGVPSQDQINCPYPLMEIALPNFAPGLYARYDGYGVFVIMMDSTVGAVLGGPAEGDATRAASILSALIMFVNSLTNVNWVVSGFQAFSDPASTEMRLTATLVKAR